MRFGSECGESRALERAHTADSAIDLDRYGLERPALEFAFSSYSSENTAETNAGETRLARIRKFLRPLFPIHLLQLLPLSHMFGQAATLSLAPLLRASVVMTRRQSPAARYRPWYG